MLKGRAVTASHTNQNQETLKWKGKSAYTAAAMELK